MPVHLSQSRPVRVSEMNARSRFSMKALLSLSLVATTRLVRARYDPAPFFSMYAFLSLPHIATTASSEAISKWSKN